MDQNLQRKYDFDLIIVGAGIAGSALAFSVGKLDYKVLIIERDCSEPDRIVGELLQPGGVLKLKELGLEDCLEGIDSIEVEGYGILYKGEQIQLTYPQYEGETIKGRSFHHGRFVMNLREAAKSVKNVTMIEGIATKLLEDNDGVFGVSYKEKDVIKEAFAPLTIICDGCFSNFRKYLGVPKPAIRSHFVGIILENCKLPYQNCGNVFLASPGPILGYQIGSNEVRLLIDIPDPLPSSSNGELIEYLLKVTAPQLTVEMRETFINTIKVKKIRSMPNSILHPLEQTFAKPGVMAIGDTWNMRHPLTGGGMTVAFNDVVCLRNILASNLNPFKLTNRHETMNNLQQFYGKRKPLAVTVNILACALHSVFAASEDPVLPEMRDACWHYFKLGGICVEGPMSLLSALNPKTQVLLTHFFMVGIFAAARAIWPPWPSNILKSFKILKAASWIVIPLMRGEKVFFLFRTFLSILFWKSSQTLTN